MAWFTALTGSCLVSLFGCDGLCDRLASVHKVVLLSGLLFALLLWHPVLLSAHLLRVLREEIYSGQALLILAAFVTILFIPLGKWRRILFSVLCGAILGWFWLTPGRGYLDYSREY